MKNTFQTLSNDKKEQIASEITNSKTFAKSPTATALLNYLIKANIENRFLKEGIIDLDFFGSNEGNEKNNPRVRVNMYNLRKKLNQYYENEGSNVQWKIIIDKGQYSVRFEKKSSQNFQLTSINFKIVIPYILFIITLIFLGVNSTPPKPPKIWDPFFKSDQTTTLFIGDAFGFKGETITGRGGWTRDFAISTIDEYEAFAEKHPELMKNTEPANFNYATNMAVHSTHILTKLFQQQNKAFNIRFTSNVSFDEIKNSNSIYAGMVKNGDKFVSIFNDCTPECQIKHNRLIYNDPKTKQEKKYELWSANEDRDRAIVLRVKSPQGMEQFFFFAAHDMGVTATIEYFTNTDSIKAFSDKYLQEHENFTAIFNAKGHERTNLDLELLDVIVF